METERGRVRRAAAGVPPEGASTGATGPVAGHRRFVVAIGLFAAVALAVGVAGIAVGADAGVAQDAGVVAAADAGTVQDGAAADVPPTIEGAVTTAPVTSEGRVLVGTDRGLYVLSDGEIEAFVETRPVETVVPYDGSRAMVVVEDRHYENLVAVDVTDGTELWRHEHAREVYSRDYGHVERTAPAFDAASLGDVTGDGTADVAVTAGRSVLALDGATGERVWSADQEHTVWTVAAADGDVYAGTQGGRLVALDAASGDERYAERLAAPFASDDFGPIPRSVWSVEPLRVGGSPRLAVSTEAGDVLLVERDDGEVAWRESLLEWDEEALNGYYSGSRQRQGLPAYPGDATFRNVDLTLFEAPDGGTGIAARAAVPQSATHRGYEGGIPGVLYGIDAATGEVRWETDQVSLGSAGSVAYAANVSGGRLLVSSGPREGTQPVQVVDPAGGQLGDPIDVPAVPGVRFHNPTEESGYVTATEDGAVVASTLGDVVGLSSDGEVDWSAPSLRAAVVERGDVDGDGSAEVVVETRNDRRQTTQSRGVAVRDGADGSPLWSHVIGLESFVEAGGIESITVLPRESGGPRLALLRQPVLDDPQAEAPPSVLEIRDAATGEVVERHELVDDGEWSGVGDGQRVRAQSMVRIGDVSGNGEHDLLFASQFGGWILEVASGDVVWERTHWQQPGDPEWRPIDGERYQLAAVGPGSEGLADVVVVSAASSQVATLTASGSGEDLTFEARGVVTLEGDFDAWSGLSTVGDANGDGTREVRFRTGGGENPVKVYDPAAGRIVASYSNLQDGSLRTFDADVTGDGTGTSIATTVGDEESRVTVASGYETVWSKRLGPVWPARGHGVANLRPAAPAGDLNGDGTEEVALVTGSHEVGARVEFYDVSSGTVEETVELAAWEEGPRDPFPGLVAERIPDQNGDGAPELGVVAIPDQAAGATPTYYVIDPQAGEVLVSGEGVRSQFVGLESGAGLVASDGALTVVDVTDGVSLSEPTASSTVELEWSFPSGEDYVTTVTAGDRPVAVTTDRSASVRLPAGTHRLAVEATRPDGVTVHDAVEVTVADPSGASALVLLGGTLGSLVLLSGFGAVPAIRRRLRGDRA